MVYFLSDLHLGAGYIKDHRAHEMRVVRFLRAIAQDATRLYLLGDVLDYWWEYRDVVPRGFTRFLGALAELADRGVEIFWFKGNHDIWIFDYLPSEIGLKVRDGSVVENIAGKTFFLEHGDGVGELPWSFRQLRRLFRCKLAQRLYAGLHPRLTVGFAHAWSSHSRKAGGYVPFTTDPEQNPLVAFAEEYDRSHPGEIDYFIFGHQHIVLDHRLPGSRARVVILGDWISHFTYATFDGTELRLSEFEG